MILRLLYLLDGLEPGLIAADSGQEQQGEQVFLRSLGRMGSPFPCGEVDHLVLH